MKPVEISMPRVSKGGMNPTNTSTDRPTPPKGSGGNSQMPAEAVELLRSIAQQDVARHKSYEAFTLWAQELAQDFTRRYDAAQQEQSDE